MTFNLVNYSREIFYISKCILNANKSIIYMKFLAQEDPFPANRFTDSAKAVAPIVW